MLGRVAAVAFETAAGTVSWRDPDEEQSRDGTVDFWFEQPENYRCEDTDGLVFLSNESETLVRDPEGLIQRPPAGTIASFDWHPKELLGRPDVARSFTERDDFSRPTGPATLDTVAGRRCWRFVLEPPPHKPAELEVAVDDQTGTILELRSRGVDAWTTLTRFEPNVQLAPELFQYDGAVAQDWVRESEDRDRLHQWEQRRSWPVPRYWPDSPRFQLLEAGEDGSFMARLRVGGERRPVLARW